MADISLRLPFNGEFPVSFSFGAISDNEEIKKKFTEWGIVGHNGIDYSLPEGTEVVAATDGKVIQSGDNGDFGISVTLEHPWGQSLYAHLKETKVNVGDEPRVGDIIGLSGQTGAAFGEHLHFAIKLNGSDLNNGYLGFVDPSPYFGKPEEKIVEEKPQEQQPTQPVEQPKVEEPKPSEEQKPVDETQPAEQIKPEEEKQPTPPSETQQSQPQIPEPQVIEKEVIKEVPVEVIKEVVKEIPVVNEEEVQKQVEAKLQERLKTEQDERRKLANVARTKKKTDNLNKVLEFVRGKKVVTNEDVRDFLHISQSTATNYLTELVNRGMLKKEGDRGGAKYSV